MSGNRPQQDMPLETNAEVTKDSVSPAPADTPPSKQSVRLWLLLIAHVILGLFFSIWSAVQGRLDFVLELLLVVPVIGFTLAQASLLGFWAVFSKVKWWMRLTGLIVAIIYLEYLLGIGTHSEPITWIVVLTTGGIAAVFGVIRWRYADLCRFPQHAPPDGHWGSKLSISGLMLFTLLVAIAIGVVEELRENAYAYSEHFVIFILSQSFVVIGLASVWAGLGSARPILRSVVVLMISAAIPPFTLV